MNKMEKIFSPSILVFWLVTVAARSEGRVCGHSPAEGVGSNRAGEGGAGCLF